MHSYVLLRSNVQRLSPTCLGLRRGAVDSLRTLLHVLLLAALARGALARGYGMGTCGDSMCIHAGREVWARHVSLFKGHMAPHAACLVVNHVLKGKELELQSVTIQPGLT